MGFPGGPGVTAARQNAKLWCPSELRRRQTETGRDHPNSGNGPQKCEEHGGGHTIQGVGKATATPVKLNRRERLLLVGEKAKKKNTEMRPGTYL